MAVPHQLFFSGTTKGESAMTSQEDVGSAVEYKFTVTNPGQSLQTLGSAFLNVMWPHELSNGKWLLYPTGMYFKGDRNTHCSTSQPLNPLRLTDYHNLPGQTDYHSRKGRSNQEKSRIQTQGIVGRTTPAVSASERRKLLTLISVMVYPEHAVSDHTGVPWWIILIAILAGILMLALLVCLLWKCGFFKRTERQPHYETEYYRAHLQLQPSEAEKQAFDQN
ncbi:UNVERIFIED_CONTAM: hypothetical protein FKN15_046337 [Acipenser sinensis]